MQYHVSAKRFELAVDHSPCCSIRDRPDVEPRECDLRARIHAVEEGLRGADIRSLRQHQQIQIRRELGGVEIGHTSCAGSGNTDADRFALCADVGSGLPKNVGRELRVGRIEIDFDDRNGAGMLRQHSLQQRPPALDASYSRRRCDREPDREFSGGVLRESRVERPGISLETGCHPRHHGNRQVGAAQLELRRERPGYGLVDRNPRKAIGAILGLRDSRCQEA